MALNRARLGGDRDCVILEIGDRTQGDEVSYPTDDIQAVMDRSGKWQFVHRMGRLISMPAWRLIFISALII
jgi:uncharacterized cupin superfamily protein